jgi:hypothetical protein
MPNFDVNGRDIGDAVAIPEGRDFIGLNVQTGDEVGRAEAIRKIREASNKTPASSVEPQSAIQITDDQEALDDSSSPDELEVEPPIGTDAEQSVSKRSLKLDELDELIIDFEGEELTLSKDDLKKGVGLYKVNNKKAEELAREKKALEAQKAEVAQRASQEISSFGTDIANREQRNRQIDELLEYAYANKYTSLTFKDGSKTTVNDLEYERKANELAIRRIETQAEQKRKELETYSAEWRERQEAILREKEPEILMRLDDIANYLERLGFSESESQALINADAKLVLALDRARKYDNALNSKGERKKSVQTKVISKSTSQAGARTGAVNSNLSNWQEVLSKSPAGSTQYREALKHIRLEQMKR